MFCGKPIARMYTMPSLRFDYKQKKKKNSNSDFMKVQMLTMVARSYQIWFAASVKCSLIYHTLTI